MIGYDTTLFQEYVLDEALAARRNDISQEIDDYNKNDLLNTSVDDLCAYFEGKHRLSTPKMNLVGITQSVGERDVTVDRDFGRRAYDGPMVVRGTYVTISIPFEGDAFLFRCAPSAFSTSIPRGHVMDGVLEISYTCADPKVDPIARREIDSDIGDIQQWLGWVDTQVTTYNNELPGLIRGRIENRRKKILDDLHMADSLGFPLKRREDAPATYAVPLAKKIVIEKPRPSSGAFAPEPSLAMAQYEDILAVIWDMSRVMENSPSAFQKMKEEDLRQHFLVHLNGHFKGEATAETFNGEGKTDVLIKDGGRTIFIAECKFWKGEAVLTETIDQLLSYLSWRDTKTAIPIFNKNKDTSAVIAQIPDIVKKHPNHKGSMPYDCESGFRFKLHQNDDRNRELILTVMVFDVPHKTKE